MHARSEGAAMRTRNPMAAAALLLAALGCADQSSPLAPTAEPTAGQNLQSGAENTKSESPGFLINDPDRNYSLLVGVPLSQVPACGGVPEDMPVKGHTVIPPFGAWRYFRRVRQSGLELYYGSTDDPCDLIFYRLMGRGTGNVTWQRWSRRGFEVQEALRVTGRMELLDGRPAHLLVVVNYVLNIATGAITVHVDRFEVKPIGG